MRIVESLTVRSSNNFSIECLIAISRFFWPNANLPWSVLLSIGYSGVQTTVVAGPVTPDIIAPGIFAPSIVAQGEENEIPRIYRFFPRSFRP
jgi:hypothetical protein